MHRNVRNRHANVLSRRPRESGILSPTPPELWTFVGSAQNRRRSARLFDFRLVRSRRSFPKGKPPVFVEEADAFNLVYLPIKLVSRPSGRLLLPERAPPQQQTQSLVNRASLSYRPGNQGVLPSSRLLLHAVRF